MVRVNIGLSVSKKKTFSNHSNLYLLPIIVLGTALRLIRIGSLRLTLDEAFTFHTAGKNIIEIIRILALDTQPPLDTLLYHYWLFFGRNETVLRLLPIFISLFSILVIYQVGKRLFNDRVGLTSALILSISPFHIRYAQDARNTAY